MAKLIPVLMKKRSDFDSAPIGYHDDGTVCGSCRGEQQAHGFQYGDFSSRWQYINIYTWMRPLETIDEG